MGLGIVVGVLADLMSEDEEGAAWVREELEAINAVLDEQGLPQHSEPVSLPVLESRAACERYPYSFLHYLRRVYARLSIEHRGAVAFC